MKSSVLITIITLFCIGSLHSHEHDDFCFLESQRQFIVQQICMDSIFNPADFLPRAQQTIVNYNGDVEAARRFAQIYCPILSRVIACLPLALNISVECRTPAYYESDVLRVRVLGVMLDWACDNEAQVLIDALQDGGLKTFMFSNEFHRCEKILSETTVYDRNATTFVVNPEYCLALDEVLECYKILVQDHKNRKLIRLAGDLHQRIRDMWGC